MKSEINEEIIKIYMNSKDIDFVKFIGINYNNF
jgi:hypothetical protein